jgi:hypothetical protein
MTDDVVLRADQLSLAVARKLDKYPLISVMETIKSSSRITLSVRVGVIDLFISSLALYFVSFFVSSYSPPSIGKIV